MNRHIIGLSLFLFIVKTHLLVYWVFFAPGNLASLVETPPSPAPPTAAVSVSELPTCVSIEQAVFDANTKLLHVRLRINPNDETFANASSQTTIDDKSQSRGALQKKYVKFSLMLVTQNEDARANGILKDLKLPFTGGDSVVQELTVSDIKIDNFDQKKQNLFAAVQSCGSARDIKEVLIVAPQK